MVCHNTCWCVFLVAEYWDTVVEWKCWFPIITWHVCVPKCFLFHGVHREMKRDSREISEIVRAHTRACTPAEITRTRLLCMFVCLLFIHVCLFVCFCWVYLTAGCLTLIRSRSSYNHTCQHAFLCVWACIYVFFFCLFFWVYLIAGWLTLCFSSIQGAWFEQQHVVGPATGHFCRAFIASVSVRVSRGWVLRYCAWVTVLIFYHYWPCISLCF